MPLTLYGEQTVAYPAVFGGTAAPSTYYFGLQTSSLWAASTAATTNSTFIIPTAFNTGGLYNRMFVCTASGTTGSTEPAWGSVAAGGSVTDGTVTWQDVASTSYWLGSTPSFNEVSTSGTGYARVSYANNTTNFAAPTSSNPTVGHNSNIIGFGTSTASWGTLAAVSIHTAATAGSVIAFAYLSSYLTVGSSGITPSIPSSGLTIQLT